MSCLTSHLRYLSLAAAATLCLMASPSSAACTSPAGSAGDIVYGTNNVMAYCNGTNWISMGTSGSASFGTLTTGDFCLATSGTNIACNTAAVNAATQISGVLPAADGGTGINNGSNTITLGGNLVTSGAFPLTLTTTGATNVTLPTSGMLVNTVVTTLSSLSSLPALGAVGTITSGTWNGTAITVPYGGTGNTSLTQYGVVLGNGTGALAATAVGTTGTVLIGNTSANPTFSGTVTLTKVTGLSTPTANSDAATKAYVDTAVAAAGSFVPQCALTPTSSTGNLGGVSGATATCVTAFGTGWTFAPSYKLGSLPIGSTGYAYLPGNSTYAWVNNNVSGSSCTNWTSASSSITGSLVNSAGETYGGGNSSCNNTYATLCCNF